jgi:hypothetical protein
LDRQGRVQSCRPRRTSRTIFAQPDAATVREQHGRIVAQLEDRFPEAAVLLDETGPDLLAFAGFPKEHWRQLWSTDENVKRSGRACGQALGRWIGRGGCSQGLEIGSCRLVSSAIGGFRAREALHRPDRGATARASVPSVGVRLRCGRG